MAFASGSWSLISHAEEVRRPWLSRERLIGGPNGLRRPNDSDCQGRRTWVATGT